MEARQMLKEENYYTFLCTGGCLICNVNNKSKYSEKNFYIKNDNVYIINTIKTDKLFECLHMLYKLNFLRDVISFCTGK